MLRNPDLGAIAQRDLDHYVAENLPSQFQLDEIDVDSHCHVLTTVVRNWGLQRFGL